MEIKPDFYDALRASGLKIQYDHHIRNLLRFRPVISHILIRTLREYRSLSPQEAAALIDPAHADALLVGESIEDAVPEEGEVYYDLRFSAGLPISDPARAKNDNARRSLFLLINLEAQKKFYQKYRLVTRGIFYGARMLSSQLGREFRHSNYQKLKKVYSIWICMNAPNHIGNSMTEYRITKHDEIGCMPEREADYDKLSVILICLNTKIGMGKPGSLHHFLNVLLSPAMEPDEKEQILSQTYGIAIKDEIRKELVNMCNLGEAIEENALRKGRSQGKKEGQKVGRAERLVQSVEAAMKNFHLDLRTACEGLGSSLKEYERAKKLLKG
ncbi:MAG TPA: Rpn family recombination-promoting nuclease/putative transposase [Candidatus Eisenbergiella merdipullorum]|uniref:Rpn family recombination-promoting nuclease/putative transposase n=1 Tax=Candidatus Eisenbergiella merdipullorum TaxID=2838553 RepID=A0A9D2I4K9_9FIRM|nr:Rpn family recombination-promoting nuclease/putative transposase [Candidatus Eisenbergiella merdipullorum]